MKLLHVITSLRMGGAERLMVDLLPRLKESVLEVELCVICGERTPFMEMLEQEGLTIHILSKSGSIYTPINIIKLWRLMRNYDIVHTHNFASQLFAAIGSVLCSVVLVTTEHNTSNRRRRWKWYACVDKWMYSKYKHIICISDGTFESLRRYIKTDKTPMTIVNNGVDISVFNNAIPIDKSKLSRHPERIVLSMVGRFQPQKDQDTIIRALARLPEKYELWLIGDGERRPILESLATELQVSDRVVFTGRRIDVPALLKASDIVVMSSIYEGFGLAAVEGMAAGKPIIASDVTGLSQVVNGAGLLFKSGDDAKLAELILSLNSDKYQNVANACTERAKQYDIQNMVDGYIDIYNVLELKSSQRRSEKRRTI